MSPSTIEIHDLLTSRLTEITEEKGRIEKALIALNGKGTPKRKTSGPSKSQVKKDKVGRPRKSGGRAKEALELIKLNPGTLAVEIADAMRIKPNYLYRILGSMEKAGEVRKDGRAYYPAD